MVGKCWLRRTMEYSGATDRYITSVLDITRWLTKILSTGSRFHNVKQYSYTSVAC